MEKEFKGVEKLKLNAEGTMCSTDNKQGATME